MQLFLTIPPFLPLPPAIKHIHTCFQYTFLSLFHCNKNNNQIKEEWVFEEMNEMGINKICTKKPLRRRTHSRKVAKDYIINIAEARREIVTALHLHRASSSTTLPECSYVRSRAVPKEVALAGNNTNTTSGSSTHHQQYSLLMEPLPCPQPTWSTTPPSIHPAPPLVPMEMIHEFEWGDSLASSYTWWIGFLKSLDGKKENIQHENEGKHPLFGEGIHHNKFHNSPKHGDMGMGDQTSVLDEWLIIPASDEISDQNES